ncbi:molybdopterin-dependent oxidoreductase [Chloroflexota bacterium]
MIDGETKIVRTTSAFDCGGRCPLRLHVRNNVIIRVEGDDYQDTDAQLRACLRCRAYRHLVHHPDRLKYPLKRVGRRGEGKFDRISWDEALDTLASELKRVKAVYGNQSIFLATGSGKLVALHRGVGATSRLLSMFGGFTTHYGNISSEGAVWACIASYGDVMVGHSREDFLNSKLIIMWGWDPARMISGTNTIHHLIKAKEAGVKIVVIDPRYTDSAAVLASQWIPIYPGTDTAMMIAMAYVIITENLHDRVFLNKYTIGFDRFSNYVMGIEDGVAKTPQWAAKICGVDAKVIKDLAIEYATSKPSALNDCQGPARSAMGEQYNRCAITLTAMTGNIGKHGGAAAGGLMGIPVGHMFRASSLPGLKNPVEAGGPSVRMTLDLSNRLQRRIHINKIPDAIIKGKKGGYPADIKVAWLIACNHVNQLGNSNKWLEAVEKLEFMAVSDLFLTPTAKLADIVLPANTPAEHNDLTRAWPSGPYFTYVNKAIEPIGESKSDLEIAGMLAPKLGIYPRELNSKSEEEWLREFVSTAPDTSVEIKDFDKFRREGIHRVKLDEPIVAFKRQIEDPENNPFPTPSGKIEIYSNSVAEIDNPMLPPIPKYLSTWEDRNDPLREKYPLQMISPHPKIRAHSSMYKVQCLWEVEPHRAWINVTDAQVRGIKDWDEIYVFNDRGKITILAFVTERIMPGVVAVYEGAWYNPDENGIDRGGCPNTLTKDEYSPGGASALKTCLVQVTKS